MQKLSAALSKSMEETGYIAEKDYEIYEYCLGYIIEQLKYDIAIILFGILFHQLEISVVYLITFGILRRYAGGYHAPNNLICTVMSYSSYFFVLAGALYIPVRQPHIWMTAFILSIVTVVCMAPVSTPKKPLSIPKKKKMKLKTFISSILLSIIFAIFYIENMTKYYSTINLCVIIVLVGLIAQAIINLRKE